MAYESKIQRNRYYGGTFEGKPRVSKDNELSQLADSLKNTFTPALQEYADGYVDDKKNIANLKLDELYASGKTSEEIGNEILSGNHPELTSMYADSAIKTHHGRFEAANVISQIEAAKVDAYNPAEQTLAEFYKQYLPDLSQKDKSFAMGFAGIFNEWRMNDEVKDATARAEKTYVNKINNGVKLMETVNDIDANYMTMLNTLNTGLPEGDVYFDVEDLNKVMMQHAQYILDNAQTPEQIDKAMKILNLDRGVGKGGNELGSLLSTKKEEVSSLMNKLIDDRVRLVNLGRQNKAYEEQESLKGLMREVYSMKLNSTDTKVKESNNTKIKEIRDEIAALNPDLLSVFDSYVDGSFNDNATFIAVDDFRTAIVSGAYTDEASMLVDFGKNNIPHEKFDEMIGYQEWSEKNVANQNLPIVEQSTSYTKWSKNLSDRIDAKFKSEFIQFGISEDAFDLNIDAQGWFERALIDYEIAFKDENGRAPNENERAIRGKEIFELSKEIFIDENTDFITKNNDGDIINIKPVTEIEEIIREEELAERAENQKIINQSKIQEQLTKTITDNIVNSEFVTNLPEVIEKQVFKFGEDKQNTENLYNYVVDNLPEIIGFEITKENIELIDNKQVEPLANIFDIPVEEFKQLMGRLVRSFK